MARWAFPAFAAVMLLLPALPVPDFWITQSIYIGLYSLVALGLMPMSGLAIVLVQQTASHFPEFAPALAAVVVSAIVMLELLGPLLAHFAILRAGEAGDDWSSR